MPIFLIDGNKAFNILIFIFILGFSDTENKIEKPEHLDNQAVCVKITHIQKQKSG